MSATEKFIPREGDEFFIEQNLRFGLGRVLVCNGCNNFIPVDELYRDCYCGTCVKRGNCTSYPNEKKEA